MSKHVHGFSPDGTYFALINEQGVLRVWNVNTNCLKHEYTPNLHLNGPCTALTWCIAGVGKKKKNHKASKVDSESQYIALGYCNGKISLYSLALGKIERTLKGEGHSGKISFITQNNEGLLFSCGRDCKIVAWSLQEENEIASWSVGVERPYSIAYMPQSKSIVVGARQIKVFNFESREITESFIGHTSDINIMSSFTVNKTEYVITASKMERLICLWKLGKRKQNKSAYFNLLMENVAQSLSCNADSEGNLKVACITRSRVIHIYQLSLDRIKKDKPLKPNLTIEIASESSVVVEPIPAIAVSLHHNANQQDILFCYGDKNFLVFETYKPNFKEKIEVIVRKDPKLKLTKKNEGQLNAESTTFLKSLEPCIKQTKVEYKSALAMSKKSGKSLDLPMESRLSNLNMNELGTQTGPQAQSKVQLLIQALHSKDPKLLRYVLSINNTKAIQLTVEKLPIRYIGSLVNELTLLMQRSRKNVEIANTWLRILAQTHSSQLIALGPDDLLKIFGPCVGLIEHRLNYLKELSKLNGRMQLLVNQIKRNSEVNNLHTENVLVFQDNESSASDVEENDTRHSESDSDWNEDFEKGMKGEYNNDDDDDDGEGDDNDDDDDDVEGDDNDDDDDNNNDKNNDDTEEAMEIYE